jgi:hypothetical protein
MDNKEYNRAKAFLNNPKAPSSKDILDLFFNKADFNNREKSNIEPEDVDFNLLGEADEIKTEKGTEWIVTRLLWDTPDGMICKINLIQINGHNDGMTDGEYSVRPIFPYDEEIEDIDYEEVGSFGYEEIIGLPYQAQLDNAIEDEDFEEAARLRDWNEELKILLINLKPKLLKALKDENVKTLDELLTRIRLFRNTL